MLFQGSRETGFSHTFFPGLGREPLNAEAGTCNSFYWFRNLNSKAKSDKAIAGSALCQKDNEVLWPPRQCVLKSQDRYFWGLLLSVSQGSIMIQRCGFIFSSGNCQLLGEGSRLQTVSNNVKGVVEVNLRTGVRAPGMIRFCWYQWLGQVRTLLWVSVSPGENDGVWFRCSLRMLLREGNGTPL